MSYRDRSRGSMHGDHGERNRGNSDYSDSRDSSNQYGYGGGRNDYGSRDSQQSGSYGGSRGGRYNDDRNSGGRNRGDTSNSSGYGNRGYNDDRYGGDGRGSNDARDRGGYGGGNYDESHNKSEYRGDHGGRTSEYNNYEEQKSNEPWDPVKEAERDPLWARIYVSGLPADVGVDELKDLFGGIGLIAKEKQKRGYPDQWPYKIKIYTDDEGKPKGDAVITYDDPNAAKTAPSFFNGVELRGSILKVELAGKPAPPVGGWNGGSGGYGGGRGGRGRGGGRGGNGGFRDRRGGGGGGRDYGSDRRHRPY